jgi:tetratricopeptide (TPR) repeat protein
MAPVSAQTPESVSRWTSFWILLLLVSASFALATALQPRVAAWDPDAKSGGLLKMLLGDSRKMFADQFLEQADVSFHSGYYPSIFDERKAPSSTGHMTNVEGSPEEEAHEKEMSFMGPPRDPFEKFGRHFMITEHTHLEGGEQREILPWLRLSADLDPHRIDTYTVASFWLRNSLGKVNEAREFLREGIRNNPGNYELWYELGSLYMDNLHDSAKARNAWELALRYWQQTEPAKPEPDKLGLEKILIHLATLEERDGRLEDAIKYFTMALQTSPNPDAVRRQIAELEQKVHASRSGAQVQKAPQGFSSP